MIYKIKDWDKHFENNRTRELKSLSWVPVPNKQDGDGYTELMDHKDGAAHFGCWHALLQVASRCDPRGTLVRDGDRPHDFASLARMTRISEKILKIAIERLVNNIGWIEVYDNPALGCDPSAALGCASRARVPEGKEQKEGKEGKGAAQAPAVSVGFIIPDSINTLEFQAAWEKWQRHRIEIKKKLTPSCAELQLKEFAAWGIARSIRAIEHTIRKGWQGIKEPDDRQTGQPAAQTVSPFMLKTRLDLLEQELGSARNFGRQLEITRLCAEIKDTKQRIKEATA